METKPVSIISKAFSGLLFILFLMMLTDIVECGMKNDFSLLKSDPGTNGLYIIAAMAIVNVLIQVLVFVFYGMAFKYAILFLSVAYTLLFISHQVMHLMSGEGIDIHFFLDITHHLLGILAVVYSCKWIKQAG